MCVCARSHTREGSSTFGKSFQGINEWSKLKGQCDKLVRISQRSFFSQPRLNFGQQTGNVKVCLREVGDYLVELRGTIMRGKDKMTEIRFEETGATFY